LQRQHVEIRGADFRQHRVSFGHHTPTGLFDFSLGGSATELEFPSHDDFLSHQRQRVDAGSPGAIVEFVPRQRYERIRIQPGLMRPPASGLDRQRHFRESRILL
jgi:hypothetical protein